MPWDFCATDFIRSLPKWMESRSALFVFLCVFCHSAFLPLLPNLEEWHCVSGSHFTLTRLIDPGDGSEKIPHQCETLPWFRLSWDPWKRGMETVGIFTPPPLHTALLFRGSMPQPCGAASCLPAFSHDPSTIACRGSTESIAFSPHYLTHE